MVVVVVLVDVDVDVGVVVLGGGRAEVVVLGTRGEEELVAGGSPGVLDAEGSDREPQAETTSIRMTTSNHALPMI